MKDHDKAHAIGEMIIETRAEYALGDWRELPRDRRMLVSTLWASETLSAEQLEELRRVHARHVRETVRGK